MGCDGDEALRTELPLNFVFRVASLAILLGFLLSLKRRRTHDGLGVKKHCVSVIFGQLVNGYERRFRVGSHQVEGLLRNAFHRDQNFPP